MDQGPGIDVPCFDIVDSEIEIIPENDKAERIEKFDIIYLSSDEEDQVERPMSPDISYHRREHRKDSVSPPRLNKRLKSSSHKQVQTEKTLTPEVSYYRMDLRKDSLSLPRRNKKQKSSSHKQDRTERSPTPDISYYRMDHCRDSVSSDRETHLSSNRKFSNHKQDQTQSPPTPYYRKERHTPRLNKRRKSDHIDRSRRDRKKHVFENERFRSYSSQSSFGSNGRSRSESKRRDDRIPSRFLKIEDDSSIKYPKNEAAPDYYCRDCQLSLNSELTWKTHLAGQRHYKATKVRELNKIARGSIQLTAMSRSLNEPRFGKPGAGMRWDRVSTPALLQQTVNEYTTHPMPGLNYLNEISHQKDNVVSYYCQICDAPCDMTTIMQHLIGSRHQLNCLKFVDENKYKKIKEDQIQFRKKEVEQILFIDQGRYGKQKIKVFMERPDENAKLNPLEKLYFDRPGPKWRTDDDNESEAGKESDSSVSLHDKYLDTSKGDFCCTLCNSHMNNFNMWASHVRGERHLKNEQKIPGESLSRVKSIKSDAPAELIGLLRKNEAGSIIVGLDYIRETQKPNGVLYMCHLCGAGCTELDIVDHLLQTKHRIKYLEKMEIDGKDNTIALIRQLDVGTTYRDNLVEEACGNLQEKYGRGKVDVYISKNVYRC